MHTIACFSAYEYVPDSEIGHLTGASGSEEDLLADKVYFAQQKIVSAILLFQTISDLESDTECAPKIVQKLPQLVTTKDGDVTRLEVKAVGKPKPVGKWMKQGEEIVPSNEFMVEHLEDGTSVLTITEAYPDDTGEITFEAHNPLGVAITTTELNVESKYLNLKIESEKEQVLIKFCCFQPVSAEIYFLSSLTEYTFSQTSFTPNLTFYLF